MIDRTANCFECGASIDVSLNAPGVAVPCPACGSSSRVFGRVATDSVTLRDGAGFKHKRPGIRKPISEGFINPTVSKATGNAVEHSRMVDRGANRYFERVVEYDSGKVVHHTDEPLTEHRGHGSAKAKGRRK
jgi:hypothetical protein